jgi:glucuronoarabinoxylan endo-1,4-beta-xylanase
VSRQVVTRLSQTLLPLLGWLALACEPSSQGQTIDSQTNWLQACEIDAQCSTGLVCLCGVCTSSCSGDEACDDLPGATCVASDEPGAIARCGGSAPTTPGMCLPRCSDTSCADGQMCVAGVCEHVPEAKVRVVVDSTDRRQELIGFGASIAYGETDITTHPRRNGLYEAAFAGLGLDVLRLRNRYGAVDDDLTTARTIVDEATQRLSRAPTVLLTTWSPPASLKANGDVKCQGNPGTCTLIKNASGAYDYAGFATYWRESLDAYAAIGVVPSFIGIQNNANWIPSSQELGEACKFLPVEGSTLVPINGSDVEVDYPGYAEALTATLERLEGLATIPKILAPETSNFAAVSDYTPDLDFSQVDALAHHLYGVDPESIDIGALAALGNFGTEYARPILQTEMQADGYGTAVLIHYTLEIEGGAAYVHSNLTGGIGGPGANPLALIGLTSTDFALQEPYHAMRHYALHTDPGWVRLRSTSNDPTLLASVWVSPTDDAMTAILVNSGGTEVDVELDLGGRTFLTSQVYRSVFNGSGVERFASLGALSPANVLTLPRDSVVTVALSDAP